MRQALVYSYDFEVVAPAKRHEVVPCTEALVGPALIRAHASGLLELTNRGFERWRGNNDVVKKRWSVSHGFPLFVGTERECTPQRWSQDQTYL